jgi:hypothetical protein
VPKRSAICKTSAAGKRFLCAIKTTKTDCQKVYLLTIDSLPCKNTIFPPKFQAYSEISANFYENLRFLRLWRLRKGQIASKSPSSKGTPFDGGQAEDKADKKEVVAWNLELF